MNKYELFSMIFIALDADWDDTHNEELGQFLSSINPFLFKEITSAVPSYYAEFEQIIGNKEITIDNSFELAKKYINSINVPSVVESFNTLKEDQWADACKAYLSTPHKGQDI